MIPGEFNVFLTYLPVKGVPVQKGMNTRLKAGILNVVTTGQWSLHDESKEKVYVIYYKPSKIGLPVGKYNIQINGAISTGGNKGWGSDGVLAFIICSLP